MKKSAVNAANRSRVLRAIWLNEGISRVEIADTLGLDKSTITNITSALFRKKIISEIEEGEAGPQGGRKPIKLKVNKNFCAVAGIEVQPQYCNVICLNMSGEQLMTRRIFADITAYDFPEIFRKILAEIEAEMEVLKIPLAGIGIGLSGIVDHDRGVILKSIPLGVSDEYAVLDEIAGITDVPVFIDNDGNCCSWGELVFNRDQELKDFLFCLIEFRDHHVSETNYEGLAIGMGIVIDGKVHYGKGYTAGEFRSIFAGEDDPGQVAITSENQLGLMEDPKLYKEFAVELSRNLALLSNTFALSDCFIGGDLRTGTDEFLSILKEETDRNWSYPGESSCRIRLSSMGGQAVSYGAASMIIDRLFRVPGFEGPETEILGNFL